MKSYIRWMGPLAILLLLCSSAAAAESVASGKIKGINADKKEFILTDAAGKDWTFKLGDNLTVNRGGKERSADLSAGDSIYVCYEKGVVNWTARYILVQEGETKNAQLVKGRFKSNNDSGKEFTITDDDKRDLTFNLGKAEVRVNGSERKIDDVKIGETVVLIVNKDGDKSVVKTVLVHRE